MTDQDRMKCLTTAAWLTGYARALEEDAKDDRHNALIHNLKTAAKLLNKVWDDQIDSLKPGGTD